MTLNRVVVTGYGVTSPIGNTPEEFWDSLKSGKIGIGPLTKFDTSEYNVHIAAEINTLSKRITIAFIHTLSMPFMQPMKQWPMQVWKQKT